MLNLKLCAIVSGAAFAVSAVLGLIGGADIITIALRALFFAALAFGFAAGASFLVDRFLPELASDSAAGTDESSAAVPEGGGERTGVAVDVSVGDEDEELAPYAAQGEEGGDGNLEPSALDQGREAGYTKEEHPAAAPAAARPPELVGDVDALPDLEGLSDSFVTPIDVEGAGAGSDAGPSAASSGSSGSAGGDGRFDAKEMAMAIQTILKRDEKG